MRNKETKNEELIKKERKKRKKMSERNQKENI